jgi:hypothetical protein
MHASRVSQALGRLHWRVLKTECIFAAVSLAVAWQQWAWAPVFFLLFNALLGLALRRVSWQRVRRFCRRLYRAHQIGVAAARQRARYDFIVSERKRRRENARAERCVCYLHISHDLVLLPKGWRWIPDRGYQPSFWIVEGEQGLELLFPAAGELTSSPA